MLKTPTSLLFIYFFSAIANTHGGYQSPTFAKYVKEITSRFKKEMKKEHQLISEGGGGGFLKDVEEVAVFFIAYRPASIEDARELGIIATERLLAQINSNEKVRPFLRECPFTSKGTNIMISFYEKRNTYQTNESISNIIINNNKLSYYKYDRETEKLIKIFSEPYEDGRKLAMIGRSEKAQHD